MFDLTQRFERDPAIVTRRIGIEMVLVPVRSSTEAMSHIYALNETSALIWNALSTPQSVADLVAALVGEYEVDEAEAHGDISDLIASLLQHRAIREVP